MENYHWGNFYFIFAYATIDCFEKANTTHMQLEMHLHEMRKQLEIIAWDRKKLREQLQMAIKERRMMEVMLAELEDEHDEAIVKIELLAGELQDLKNENRRLKEAHCKSLWDGRDQGDDSKVLKDAGNYVISAPKSSYNSDGVADDNVKGVWNKENENYTGMQDFMKAERQTRKSIDHYSPLMVSKSVDVGKFSGNGWEVALSRSLFSAILSLLVGVIIWEAKDPCTPLVIALFIVVGMSLKSAIEFFSTVNNKAASEAVALLNFNCFMFGTLTYPMLPRIARMLAS